MAKRNRITTPDKNEKWLKEGRGQGDGANYKPWLQIQDVPSEGRASRVKGWKTRRVHHLMSQLELMYFYLSEWSPIVVDIREQFPLLPLQRTMEIAEELGIEHPKDPSSKQPVVMTTDSLLTINAGKGNELWARTVKPVNALSKRTLEKFRIEHRYFEEQDINWGIVTNEDIPMTLARNIEFIHDFYDIPSIPLLDFDTVELIAPQLVQAITRSSLPLSKEALQQDDALGLQHGTCLSVVKHMLARKRWTTNMLTQDLRNFSRPIQLEWSETTRIVGGAS